MRGSLRRRYTMWWALRYVDWGVLKGKTGFTGRPKGISTSTKAWKREDEPMKKNSAQGKYQRGHNCILFPLWLEPENYSVDHGGGGEKGEGGVCGMTRAVMRIKWVNMCKMLTTVSNAYQVTVCCYCPLVQAPAMFTNNFQIPKPNSPLRPSPPSFPFPTAHNSPWYWS